MDFDGKKKERREAIVDWMNFTYKILILLK